MTKAQTIVVQVVLILAALLYSFYMNGLLPDRVPTHWNIHNQVDGYGPKGLSLWMMPGVMVLMLGMTLVLPALSPKNFEIDRFSPTYYYTMALVSGLFAVLHFVILRATAGHPVDFVKTMMAVMFLFFVAIGNVIGRTKKNFYVGIRTPWTLSDERVWERTHREAGRWWVVGGCVGVIAALLGSPLWISLTWLLVLVFAPVFRSYVWYRRLVH